MYVLQLLKERAQVLFTLVWSENNMIIRPNNKIISITTVGNSQHWKLWCFFEKSLKVCVHIFFEEICTSKYVKKVENLQVLIWITRKLFFIVIKNVTFYTHFSIVMFLFIFKCFSYKIFVNLIKLHLKAPWGKNDMLILLFPWLFV